MCTIFGKHLPSPTGRLIIYNFSRLVKHFLLCLHRDLCSQPSFRIVDLSPVHGAFDISISLPFANSPFSSLPLISVIFLSQWHQHHDQKPRIEGLVWLMLPEGHHVCRGKEVWHDNGSKKLGVARRKQRGTKAFSLKASDVLPLARLHHPNLPKSVTNWGPHVQMSETMGNATLVYSLSL